MLNLGEDINAAANICNKNLDRRDYGVSRILKDYLFEYDAMGPLTGVKVRTNKAASTARMDIPDWFFEEGTIFLPEEMMVGLRIDDRGLRAPLPWPHPELMTVDYSEVVQRAPRAGLLPKVRAYPVSQRIVRPRRNGVKLNAS